MTNVVRRKTRNRRGIALMDAIIGGVMLGVGLAVLISVSSRALAMQTDGEMRLRAAWLADELLTMVLVEGPDEYPRIYDESGRFDEPFKDFTYELDIVDQGLIEPYKVAATISWPGGRDTRSITVEALISRRQGEPDITREPVEPLDRAQIWDEKINAHEYESGPDDV